MSCEEAGKLSILIGTASRIATGMPVDWKSTAKRFRSHDSKASQFLGIARVLPLLEEAIATGKKSIDAEEVLIKGAVGTLFGPALFESRNASLYCDVKDGKFTSPNESITEKMTDQMIQYAASHMRISKALVKETAEETAKTLGKSASRERIEKILTSTEEMTSLMMKAINESK